MTSLGAVLEQYPSEVIIHVSDPRTGVQRGCKWPPTVSEIVEACDTRVAELERKQRFETWGQRNELALPAPEMSKPTVAELKAKYGDNYGLTPVEARSGPTFKAPSIDDLRAHYAEHGLKFKRKESANG
jgi:hypothetical protein